MFVDQADIEAIAGDGGRGCSSFRREKYIPNGGPDGGDGGRGGSVFLEAVHGVDTLLDMVGRHHWYATRGEHGMGKKKAGKDGEDLVIPVPPGTLVYDKDSSLLIADMAQPGKRIKVGKSTLLSRLSSARPKIADYPFTTLVPQLGIAELDTERRLVIADIPGLIEGAHEGHGLGLDFLRHVERTRVIVHIVDVMPVDGSIPAESYRQIRKELEAYSPKLAAKAEIVVANKMDLSGASEALADLRSALPGRQIMAISAVAGTGLRPLLETIWQQVQKAPPSEPFVAAPMFIPPEPEMEEEELAASAVVARETEELDPALAAEIEAMKADDLRKGKYYGKKKTDI
jgi:GTP-binding protein